MLDSLKVITFGSAMLAVSAQIQMAGGSFVPGQQLASLAIACSDELQTCGVDVSAALSNPAEFSRTIDFASVRPCIQSMMQELVLLPTMPEGDSCVEALGKLRRPGGGGTLGDFAGTTGGNIGGNSGFRPGGFMQQGGAGSNLEGFAGVGIGGIAARLSPCDDQSIPTCASGDRPRMDFTTRSFSCEDGSSPVCANGSAPQPREPGTSPFGGSGGATGFMQQGGQRPSFGQGGQRPSFGQGGQRPFFGQ
jgi:hypothetical protein